MHSALENACPPLIRLAAALSFSLGACIACTRNLIYILIVLKALKVQDFHSCSQ